MCVRLVIMIHLGYWTLEHALSPLIVEIDGLLLPRRGVCGTQHLAQHPIHPLRSSTTSYLLAMLNFILRKKSGQRTCIQTTAGMSALDECWPRIVVAVADLKRDAVDDVESVEDDLT